MPIYMPRLGCHLEDKNKGKSKSFVVHAGLHTVLSLVFLVFGLFFVFGVCDVVCGLWKSESLAISSNPIFHAHLKLCYTKMPLSLHLVTVLGFFLLLRYLSYTKQPKSVGGYN